ncbi:hypothetical protein CHS0354_007879, partial [Potamilus streckersoni]
GILPSAILLCVCAVLSVCVFTWKTRAMNSPPQSTEPDPDSIKMFVGQIPRNMDENDLRKMFEEFGHVYQLNILRDKVSGQSKGCCFVTFYTRKAALEAQNALHNIKTMPGMHHPIQMKPADSEKRNEERKLFVGMVSKKCTENDIRMLFAPFGAIEDCTILRDQNHQSRGCAFVTFVNRQSAQNAIKSMHHSQTMEGCSSPVVVKFADTQKEKEQKKLHQMNTNLWGNLGPIGPQYLALLQQAATGNLGMFASLGNIGNLGLLAALAGLGSLNSTNNCSSPPANSGGNSNTNSQSGDAAANNLHLQNLQGLAALASLGSPGALNALGMQNLATLNQLSGVSSGPGGSGIFSHSQKLHGSMGSLSGSTNSLSGLGSLHNMGSNSLGGGAGISSASMSNGVNGLNSGNPSGMDALSQAYSGIQQYAASFPNAFNSQAAQQLQQAAANSAAGKQTEGPEGANLFIYHLPQEFSDQDLMQTFLPFGTVISAKVFIDKQTNLSKCFGFVSFDNPVSAQAAIQAMNGFQIGMKRLKVQLKRPKNDSRPY